MPKLIMLKGLPASGKSTWAKEQVEKYGWKRVNKDDLRAMFDQSKWSKHNEHFVLTARDFIIAEALHQGNNVVVDDTNFAPKHAERLSQLAKEHGAQFEVKYFECDPEECIRRDLKRTNSVGSKVIWQMYNEYIKPAPPHYEPDTTLPPAVICDIDGTLAHMTNRGPYDTSKYMDDSKDDLVHRLFALLADSFLADRIIVSGRSDEFRQVTEDWLKKHGITYKHLFMRPAGDTRNDRIIKREIFERDIAPHYRVICAIDDRNRVVDMWRNELGLTCLQVADGDF